MKDLLTHKCVPCEKGGEKMDRKEIESYLAQISGWNLVVKNDMEVLEKSFKFKNFITALEFTNKIGEISEEHWHHPTLVTDWGKVTVTWVTHKIKGLHVNDFSMAARTDRAYEVQS